MFSILENCIIKNLREGLDKMISEISSDKFIKIYKENNINKEIPFLILGAILYLLEKDKIEEAFSLFIKSYSLKDDCFDKILIIYLRTISHECTEELLELAKDEEIMKSLEEPIDAKNISIYKRLVKNMNIEPDFFEVCLIPCLLDINMIIYHLDKDITKPKEGIIKLIDDDYPDLPFISLGYFFSSYHRIYWNDWVKEEPIIKKIFEEKKF